MKEFGDGMLKVARVLYRPCATIKLSQVGIGKIGKGRVQVCSGMTPCVQVKANKPFAIRS